MFRCYHSWICLQSCTGQTQFLGLSGSRFSRNTTSCGKGKGQAGWWWLCRPGGECFHAITGQVSVPPPGMAPPSRGDCSPSVCTEGVAHSHPGAGVPWGAGAGQGSGGVAGERSAAAPAPGMSVPRGDTPPGIFIPCRRPCFANGCKISHLPTKSSGGSRPPPSVPLVSRHRRPCRSQPMWTTAPAPPPQGHPVCTETRVRGDQGLAPGPCSELDTPSPPPKKFAASPGQATEEKQQ